MTRPASFVDFLRAYGDAHPPVNEVVREPLPVKRLLEGRIMRPNPPRGRNVKPVMALLDFAGAGGV